MKTETDKIIKEQLEYLPEEIVALFADPKTTERILEIGKIAQLNNEQLEILQTETSLLILGLADQDGYKNELKNQLVISEGNLNNILKEIYTLIPADMMEELNLIYKERDEEALEFDPTFSGFPEKVQEAIANSGWKEKLYGIANKYKLTVSQMGILEEVTIQVMRNEIHPNEYEGELSSRITIPKEDISNIVKDVNTDILISIRELLKGNVSENKQIKNLSEKTEEVPLPPYAKIITNDKLLINNEEKMPESYKPTEIPIENINIPVNIPKNIVEEKLKGATISNHSTSDYSTPKISTPETEGKPKAFDPYREAF